MHAWVDVAVLAHTKNLNGGLVARSASGLPLLLEEGMEVVLVPPVLDAPRRVHVTRTAPRNDRESLVFFDEVTDASTADALVGCHCLVRRAAIDWNSVEEERGIPFWDDWEVSDEDRGFVGSIAEVEDRPVQPLLHIRRPDGSIMLVPLVEEFISDVDEEGRRVVLRCPEGLFDL